jgi:oligopeptide transport system ATP-binding protein
MKKLLEVQNLKIAFNTTAGLLSAARGVDFCLDAGETLAIAGESGCGKSATVKALMGLSAPNAQIGGAVIFEGKDILKMSEKELQNIRGGQIAMIFQDHTSALNPLMTIGKQISEGIILHQNLNKKEAYQKTIELLCLVGINEPEIRFKQYPHQFSGGMRQRIAIAAALGCNPKILIADEPTTALDVTIQAQILELLKDIQKKLNIGIIFITHDLGVAANIADRIAIMYAGKIVESGLCDEIFYEPRHPYTWSLLACMPDINAKSGKSLFNIAGSPPNMLFEPKGDAFAPRNPYALEIDFQEEPPLFQISPTHYAATWLLDPRAPKVEMPDIIKRQKGQELE